jgi:hypothetical protein
MSDVRSAVRDFLRERGHWDGKKPLLEADLFHDLGIDGDDAFKFVDDFFRKFEIDGETYRWYFHHGEEGQNFGSLFFSSPHQRVERIPITLNALADAIDIKRWPIKYPPHELPAERRDLQINLGCLVVGLAAAAITLVLSLIR